MGNGIILCVDDERVILNGLQSQLGRDFGSDHAIELAENGEEALELISELIQGGHEILVVISDQLMPGLKGHELLNRIHQITPSTYTILLTGHSDLEPVTQAVNHANLYRYISKPWEGNDLLMTVKEAIRGFYQDKQLKEQNQLLERHNNELGLLVQERTRELTEEKDRANRAVQLKHKFMANMSHEIRTPMNAIVGMTRLVLSKDPKPEHLHYLNAIRISADNLLVIINDILDFSKIEAGKVTFENIDFNLRQVLNGINDMLCLKAQEKGLSLIIETEEQVPQMIKGDPTKVNQVLTNLAGNAIKFTDKGSVTIKAVLKKKEERKLTISFEVSDTGIGIAPEYIDRIFESFTQAGSDITRKFGGTGLGLSISKQLANLMGGDIFIESELGKGTTFSAVMVFEESDASEETPKTALPEASVISQLSSLKILLVEDNEFNRMVAEDTLSDLIPGIEVHLAANGLDALERLKTELFDIVLMDIQMPVMDGLMATKAIRNDLTGPSQNVKIVAMTANVMQEDVKAYYELGMNGHVSKPFDPSELIRVMNMVTSDTLPVKLKSPPSANTAEPLDDLPVTDTQFLKQITRGDGEKVKKYIAMFLENAPKMLQQLKDGLAAGDYKVIKIAAHSLKPQLSYMGVKEEVSSVARIEAAADDKWALDLISDYVSNLEMACQKAFQELKEL